MTRVGIHGIAGQMGVTLFETAASREDPIVVFGVDSTPTVDLGVPTYGPDGIETALDEHDPDAVIDFSVPDACASLTSACVAADVPLVVGTTGFDDEALSVLQEASATIPVLRATNFSRGIQALLRALGPALNALPNYDVEVLETHHNRKRDAPSGTAKTILEEIGEHREFDTVAGREGIQSREDSEVGMLVRRAGGIRGEHEVLLAANDEVLTLTHRAEDRAVFAAGALDSAAWLAGREAGWYTFGDVVNESE